MKPATPICNMENKSRTSRDTTFSTVSSQAYCQKLTHRASDFFSLQLASLVTSYSQESLTLHPAPVLMAEYWVCMRSFPASIPYIHSLQSAVPGKTLHSATRAYHSARGASHLCCQTPPNTVLGGCFCIPAAQHAWCLERRQKTDRPPPFIPTPWIQKERGKWSR